VPGYSAFLRELDEEIPYVGDEAFLHQLFLIFLDNAIKYSPGSTTVHVTLEIRRGEVRASFADQGLGISPSTYRYLERFLPRGSASSNTQPLIGK